MLLGDFTGGGLVVIAAKTVVQSAYSREVETAADLYGVELMAKARRRSARAWRRSSTASPARSSRASKILLDHPQTKDRVAAINAAADRAAGRDPAAARRRPNGPRSRASADRCMARRRFADEPTSRLAIWARRCAFFALAATVLSILIVRSGILEIVPALATFAGALVFAVIGIVLAFGAFIVIWKDGIARHGPRLRARSASALALIAYPAYLGYRAYQLPMINDITTDPLDPPRFDVLARLRPRGTVEYAGLYAAELQRKAYPDIEPLERQRGAARPPMTRRWR